MCTRVRAYLISNSSAKKFQYTTAQSLRVKSFVATLAMPPQVGFGFVTPCALTLGHIVAKRTRIHRRILSCVPRTASSSTREESRSETNNGKAKKRVLHEPVVVRDVVAHVPPDAKVVLDCTLGAGGHARAILEARPGVQRYVGLDKDETALATTKAQLHELAGKLELVHGDFGRLGEVAQRVGLGDGGVDFVLLDVGMSSMQLDDATRGFSFARDGPLDMRMDAGACSIAPRAAELVNNTSEAELIAILCAYGEESAATRIARAIVAARPLATTSELGATVIRAKGGWRRRGLHPATQTFQALRIAINDELNALQMALPIAARLLRVGGRIAVLTFHSLEDRIAKREFAHLQTVPGGLRILTRKPITPDLDEVRANPRARSAKLRVAQRIGADVVGARIKENKYATRQ